MLERIKERLKEYETFRNEKVIKFRINKPSQVMISTILIEAVTESGICKIDSGILFEDIASSPEEYYNLLERDYIEF